jgi:hypothetical protein
VCRHDAILISGSENTVRSGAVSVAFVLSGYAANFQVGNFFFLNNRVFPGVVSNDFFAPVYVTVDPVQFPVLFHRFRHFGVASEHPVGAHAFEAGIQTL